MSVVDLKAQLQKIRAAIESSPERRVQYYGRQAKLNDFRKEIEPLAVYFIEAYAGQKAFVLWDQYEEWYDARIYRDESAAELIEYVQLTLTDRVREDATLDRLTAKALNPKSSVCERTGYTNDHLNTQVIHPTFIKDLQAGLYELLAFIAVAAVKKLDKDYSQKNIKSTIVIGVDLPPFFDIQQHVQRDALRFIAWSLSNLQSNVSDIVIVTWPERHAISAMECSERFDTDLRFLAESYPDTSAPDLPRENRSGYLSHVITNIGFMLDKVGRSIFPPTNKLHREQAFVHTTVNIERQDEHIVAEWPIPILDARSKLTGEQADGIRVIFTADFCEVMAARNDIENVTSNLQAEIERFIFRYYAVLVQDRAQQPKALTFGSAYFTCAGF